MHKGIIIYLSILVGLALTIGGGYFVIDNLAQPKGLLFEGIIAAALGVTLLMVVIVAATVGKAIMLFSEILEETTKLNQEISKRNRPMPLGSIFQNMLPGNSMTITNLDTGETKSPLGGDMSKMNEMIMNAMAAAAGSKINKDLNSLADNELEEMLATAIKEDDFEKAAEVSAVLRSRRDEDDSEENNPE
jgi:hypothetical protein